MVVDVTPRKVYDGPHLSSELGSNRVATRYDDDYSVIYDFNTDTITSDPKTRAATTEG